MIYGVLFEDLRTDAMVGYKELKLEEIIKIIGANISVLAVIALFVKKRFEKYIDGKINHQLARQLENHKLELQKDLEKFKEKLYSGKPLKDDFVQRNKELMEHIGDIRSSVQFLIRAHAEEKQVREAWERYYAKMPSFEDFIVRYKAPYFLQYDEDIKALVDSLNEVTKSIEDTKTSGGKSYNCDFQKVTDNSDKLKEKIYSSLTYAQI